MMGIVRGEDGADARWPPPWRSVSSGSAMATVAMRVDQKGTDSSTCSSHFLDGLPFWPMVGRKPRQIEDTHFLDRESSRAK